jgi:hydroxyethylthiazole kinase-like sugar kinase family protein
VEEPSTASLPDSCSATKMVFDHVAARAKSLRRELSDTLLAGRPVHGETREIEALEPDAPQLRNSQS